MKKTISIIALTLAILLICSNITYAKPKISWKITITLPIPSGERCHRPALGCQSGFFLCNKNNAIVSLSDNPIPTVNADGSVTAAAFIYTDDETGSTWVEIHFPSGITNVTDLTQTELSTFNVDETWAFFTDNNSVTYTFVTGDEPVSTDGSGNYVVNVPLTTN